jgi:CDGSH-type Zn-finger protein
MDGAGEFPLASGRAGEECSAPGGIRWRTNEGRGRASWRSARKPYCDGSHSRKQTGKTPHVCDIAEVKTYAICQCGTSATKPFCDGSHKKLAP